MEKREWGSLKLVPGRCTFCGKDQMVDPAEPCTVCFICKESFVTEEAIRHYKNPFPDNFVEKQDTEYADGNKETAQYPGTEEKSKKHRVNIGALVSGGILALGAFLPYFSVSFLGMRMSKSLLEGTDGVLFLLLAIASVVFALMGNSVFIITCGVFSILLALFENSHLTQYMASNEYGAFMNKDIGYYLLVIGAIGIFASGIYGIVKERSSHSQHH